MTKTMKLGLLALMVAALALAVGGLSMAFHEAAELKCMACHTMHGSEDGGTGGITVANGFEAVPDSGYDGPHPKLLLQPSVTDLCLACHSTGGSAFDFTDEDGDPAPHVMTNGPGTDPGLPGGDYYSVRLGGGDHRTGHNPYYSDGPSPTVSGLIASDAVHGLDGRDPPGNTITISRWDCVACHAPHKDDYNDDYLQAGWRMLWANPANAATSGVSFVAKGGNVPSDDPDESGSTAGADPIYPESDEAHTAYQDNVSQWCGQCHRTFHVDAGSFLHPSDRPLPGTYVSDYNSNPSGAANYSFIVPVQDLGATTHDFAAGSGSIVMCLSCHRAHAAAANASHPDYDVPPYSTDYINDTRNMTRWDMTRPSGAGRGCNKCHDKGDN
jgi:hypothetical protein